MYKVDLNTLKTQIGFVRASFNGVEAYAGVADALMYSKIAIDIIVEMLNKKSGNQEDIFEQVVKGYSESEQTSLFALGEIIVPLANEIKLGFRMAGFDPRLKYKLREIKYPFGYEYIIMMDLEETFYDFQPATENVPMSDIVDEHPDQEILDAYFNTTIHPGN